LNKRFDYHDDVLVNYVHENDELAEGLLYQKYVPTIEYLASKYKYQASKLGLDVSDLVQEGFIGLSQAIKDYQHTKGVKFITFAHLCIEREMQTAVISGNRKKHSMLNESVSLDKEVFEDTSLINYVSSNSKSPEELIMNEEQNKLDLEVMNANLTTLELDVCLLRLQGFDYIEISKRLERSPKSIDNALQRIKKKLSIYM